MDDKNLLIKSIYNIRVFLSLVFRTDHLLCGRWRYKGYTDIYYSSSVFRIGIIIPIALSFSSYLLII